MNTTTSSSLPSRGYTPNFGGRRHYIKAYGWSEREGIPTPSMSALTACGKNSAVQLQHGRVTFFPETTNCSHCQRKLKKESENV